MGELCFSCFIEKNSSGVCPGCGYDPAQDKGKYSAAIKQGEILKERYIVGRVLGQGGFGVTYSALDFATKERVAIKEFMPTALVNREASGYVRPYSGEMEEHFTQGKAGFLEEANTLEQFKDNPHIVNILDYFEENGTAYFVMDYVQGQNLKAYVKIMGGKLGEEAANRILMPIMEAMEDVHSKGIVHRDIAPDNIIVTAEGSAKLIDFGAARHSTGEKSLSLDVILKHGYAPKEQYSRHGRQGPYTDVYAMAATYYYAVTGRVPPDSIDRVSSDELAAPGTLGAKLSAHAEKALMKALSIQPEDRYPNMGDFLRALRGEIKPDVEKRPEPEKKKTKQKKSGRKPLGIIAALLVLAAALVLIPRYTEGQPAPVEHQPQAVNTMSPEEAEPVPEITPEPEPEYYLEETEIFNNYGIAITAKQLIENETSLDVILEIVNNSDKKILYSIYTSVNNSFTVQLAGATWEEIEAGQTVTETIWLNDMELDMVNIEKISSVELTIELTDTRYYERLCPPITARLKVSNRAGDMAVIPKTEDVLYDAHGIRMISLGMKDLWGDGEDQLLMLVENYSSDLVEIVLENGEVDGIRVHERGVSYVLGEYRPGTCGLGLCIPNLSENGIIPAEIESVSFDMEIRAWDRYNVGYTVIDSIPIDLTFG